MLNSFQHLNKILKRVQDDNIKYMAVVTDKKQVDDLLSRGVESIYPSRAEFEKALLSGKKLKIYCGFDPSAPSLHIGNAITMGKLAEFQALGHQIIFLIGDFTGMIGDPTDKKATRKKLTRKEVLANAKNYKKQASAYISFSGKNPAKVMQNSKWQDKLTFRDLIEVASNFTVQQMIIRDMFQERMKEEKPIHLHEFLYPLAQGYDSVAMDIDVEVGGNDQMFNMMAGRTLMRAMKNKEKFVLTLKLLVDPSGKKMGKSEGNIVNLDENPNDMYGKVMSWPDGVLPAAFEICTKLPFEEVKDVQRKLLELGTNPRDYKMKLAFEITKINHGEKKATEAQEHFIKTVQNKEIADEDIIDHLLESLGWKLVDLLVELKLAASKSEARRLIEQGGIKVGGEVVKDFNSTVEPKDGLLIQRGKRQVVRLKLKK